MSYVFESRVRYSEIGADGYLTLQGIVNYFQDCCIFHSEAVGMGVSRCKETKKGWVLSSWQILVERYPQLGETLVVKTWPYDFKGFLGSRNFTMETAEGERLAYANSLWSFVNTETGMPVKLREEDTAAYQLEEKLEMAYAPRKVHLPENMKNAPKIQVMHFHVDTNHHVNNGQYVQMAQEYLPEDFVIGQLRAEYKQQAHLGDWIFPQIRLEDDLCVVALEDEKGNPYCVTEFQRQL